jgi:hypothetical protein
MVNLLSCSVFLPIIGNDISVPEEGAARERRWQAADQLWRKDCRAFPP